MGIGNEYLNSDEWLNEQWYLHGYNTSSLQNGGAHLCVVDDANDHILSVWDWQKEKQLAEVKVRWHPVLKQRY